SIVYYPRPILQEYNIHNLLSWACLDHRRFGECAVRPHRGPDLWLAGSKPRVFCRRLLMVDLKPIIAPSGIDNLRNRSAWRFHSLRDSSCKEGKSAPV